MDTVSKPNIVRSAATYGLYIGVFLILINLFASMTGGGYLMMIIKLAGSIGLLVYAMKRYRDIDNGGYISYGNAFTFGILTSVFSTILYVAYTLVMIATNVSSIKEGLYLNFDELVEKGFVQEEAYATFSIIVENVEWLMPLVLFYGVCFLALYTA